VSVETAWVVWFCPPHVVGEVSPGTAVEVIVPYEYAIDEPGAVSAARGRESLKISEWVPVSVFLARVDDNPRHREYLDRVHKLAEESARHAR
jgi:hypothetical protein